MGCQEWFRLSAPILLTYFGRSGWCDCIRCQIILEKNSRTMRPFSKICVSPNVLVTIWLKSYLTIDLNISIAISLQFMYKRSQRMKLLDIENFMKDVNVGKVSHF